MDRVTRKVRLEEFKGTTPEEKILSKITYNTNIVQVYDYKKENDLWVGGLVIGEKEVIITGNTQDEVRTRTLRYLDYIISAARALHTGLSEAHTSSLYQGVVAEDNMSLSQLELEPETEINRKELEWRTKEEIEEAKSNGVVV